MQMKYTKDVFKELIDLGFSIRKISEKIQISQTNVRYWLKKFELKTYSIQDRVNKRTNNKECIICNKPFKNSKRRLKCQSCFIKVRRYRLKVAAVAYLGGKCMKCGWAGELCGYDFHHLYKKDFVISNAASKSLEKIKNELDKCELLCAICHRIEHKSSRAQKKFLEIVSQNNIIIPT